MLYQTIQNEREKIPVSKACELLAVNRGAYFEWKTKPAPVEKTEPEELINEIRSIAKKPRYGYKRVYHELKRRKIIAGKKKVLKIMRNLDLLCTKRKYKQCTTDSNHGLRTYPNLIKELKVIGLNHVWVSDITYIQLTTGRMIYLATVMDRFSRRFLGWELSENIDALLCINALSMAFKEREGMSLAGLIHHSDQGSQYASNEYIELLKSRGITISMSRKGNPYDNAFAESGFKTIKYEEILLTEYNTIEEARENIKYFIEENYNKERLHSAIGYKPPAEFEQQYKLKEVVA
jgi:transposase InsO family protein